MIFIRCDANQNIGMGHMMRCLSVANALKKRGEEVCFLTEDNSAGQLLFKKEMPCIVLMPENQFEQPYQQPDQQLMQESLERELPYLIPIIQEKKPSLLLIDSYRVTENYLSTLRQYVKTAYIDDMFAFPYPVDMLINYNIYGEMLPYAKASELKETTLLLGTKYVPLRDEFRKVPYTVNDSMKNVLITTGGTDRYNLAGKLIKTFLDIKELKDIYYHVVSGAFNTHLKDLQELSSKYSNVIVHVNVSDMASLMKSCDVAISAGGSTIYELCAVGVPILCFSFIDNQEQIVQTFVKKDVVPFGGDYLKQGDSMFLEIAKNLILLDNQNIRQKYHDRERQLVDGNGSERLADCILKQETCDMFKEDK